MKLKRYQWLPRHSLKMAWSPPSQLALTCIICSSSLIAFSAGESIITPELNLSGHPMSGTAANSWSRVKRPSNGRSGNTSASKYRIFAYWVNPVTSTFVRAVWRSSRPAGEQFYSASSSALRQLCREILSAVFFMHEKPSMTFIGNAWQCNSILLTEDTEVVKGRTRDTPSNDKREDMLCSITWTPIMKSKAFRRLRMVSIAMVSGVTTQTRS